MSKILVTTFGKRVKDSINDKTKFNKAIKDIQSFFDRNNEQIFDSNPGRRLIFAIKDQEIIFDFTDILPEEVEHELTKVKVIDKSWKLLNTPFVILSILCIRELEIQKKEKERDLLIMFLAMKFYSSRQRRSFPFEPNPSIMAYTINNLSERFKYKKLQNNYNVVKDTVMTSHQTYTKILVEGDDEMFLSYVPQMENRIGKIMNAVAEEFYKDRENKNYLNTSESFNDEGESVDNENLSSNISQLAEAVGYDFITQKINMGLVKIVSDKNNLPFTAVYQALNEIRIKEDPTKLISMMRSLFNVLAEADVKIFEKVCSKDFIVIALRQLAVSNTMNKDLLNLKEYLDKILMEHCTKYNLTQRQATKMQYRSAIYNYMVYLIVLNKCR